jgi:predicted AlkP superfamily pyrophosphatase or phosphodiesterase
MPRNKLILVSMDALIAEDLAYLAKKPAFSRLLGNCARVEQVRSIYPTLTYPCHATMATGMLCRTHGIVNNTEFIPGVYNPPWLWYHDAYRCRDLLDACKEAGLATAAVGWPTMGSHPACDYLVGEIAATTAVTEEEFRRDYRRTGTGDALWESVCRPNIHWRTQEKCVAMFNASVCCDIIRRYAPDLVLLHTGEPDHARHTYGVHAPEVENALDMCERILELLQAAIAQSGAADRYNLVITADHGQLDTTHTANPNVLLANHGFIQLDDAGNVRQWRAWCLNTGMSAEVFVKDPAHEPAVLALLRQHQEAYGCSHVYTREEAEAEGFTGDFAFILETDGHTRFDNAWQGPLLAAHGSIKGSHGYHPDKGPRPPLLATGPGFRTGVKLPTAHLADGAPTWAALLGVALPNTDGTALHQLLQIC